MTNKDFKELLKEIFKDNSNHITSYFVTYDFSFSNKELEEYT